MRLSLEERIRKQPKPAVQAESRFVQPAHQLYNNEPLMPPQRLEVGMSEQQQRMMQQEQKQM